MSENYSWRERTGKAMSDWVGNNTMSIPKPIYFGLQVYTHPSDLSLMQAFSAILKGYRPHVVQEYDLVNYDITDYFSLWNRDVLMKQACRDDLKGYQDKTKFFERMVDSNLKTVHAYTYKEAHKHLRDRGQIFMKPNMAAGGRGNQTIRTTHELEKLREEIESGDLLATPKIDPPEWLPGWADGVGTTRIVVSRPKDSDSYDVIGAAQRMVTEESYPVDNWAAGGVCANIDIETGEIGHGTLKPRGGELEWVDRHSDFRSDFYGLKVPRFEEACRMVEEAAELFPTARLSGWDVVITKDDIWVFEANIAPDIFMMQVHDPLPTGEGHLEV